MDVISRLMCAQSNHLSLFWSTYFDDGRQNSFQIAQNLACTRTSPFVSLVGKLQNPVGFHVSVWWEWWLWWYSPQMRFDVCHGPRRRNILCWCPGNPHGSYTSPPLMILSVIIIVFVMLMILFTFQCVCSLCCEGRDEKEEEGRKHLSPERQQCSKYHQGRFLN